MVRMKLHNLCIDQNVEMPSCRFFADAGDADQWAVYDNERDDDIFLHGRATGDHRQDITAKLEQLGIVIVRPAHARCNSHIN
jgi:hypothetical protein